MSVTVERLGGNIAQPWEEGVTQPAAVKDISWGLDDNYDSHYPWAWGTLGREMVLIV